MNIKNFSTIKNINTNLKSTVDNIVFTESKPFTQFVKLWINIIKIMVKTFRIITHDIYNDLLMIKYKGQTIKSKENDRS